MHAFIHSVMEDILFRNMFGIAPAGLLQSCVGLLLSCGNVASESYGSALAASLQLFISHSHNKR